MIRFAENLNKMITAGLGGALEAPRTEVAVGHRVVYTEVSGAVVNFETNAIASVKNLRVTIKPIQEGTGDPSPDNIRPITGRESVTVWREASYDPSTDPALTIPLGQTVYGGTVDVTTGVITVEWKSVDMATLNWELSSNRARFILKDAAAPPASTVIPTTLMFSAMTLLKANSMLTEYGQIAYTYSIGGNTLLAYYNGTLPAGQLVYKLATPQTIQLTPAQLATLKGQNNVWSDAGDVTLEYPYYEETEGY